MSTQEANCSLCVTIRYKNADVELLRLAEIIENPANSGKTGGIFFPFNNTSDFPNVKTISVAPYDANPNELCIWEWEVRPNNPKRQYSDRTKKTFYELIFLNNPDLNNGLMITPPPIWELFDLLLDGFIVPPHHSSSFLLIINQTETEYICLEIAESSYNRDGNKVTINENTLLKEYKILKSDVIDTSQYIQNLSHFKDYLDPELQRRIIYIRRHLWASPVATLPLKRFNAYLAGQLRQAMDNLSGQARDREVIETFVKNVIKNVKPDLNLMVFLEGYYPGSNEDTFVSTLRGYHPLESVLNSYLKQTSMDEKFLEFIVENLPSFREKYLQVLTEGYLEEEKQKLLHQLVPLRTQIEELNNEFRSKNILKDKLDAEIMVLEASNRELIVQIHENEQRKQEFNEFLNDKRTGLFQELTTLKKLLQSNECAFETPVQNINPSVLTVRPGNNLECRNGESVEEITQLSDMFSLLQDNLPEKGTDTPDVLELSKFISASYLCHFPLLCVGTSAGDMAHIISMSFNNQLPDTICIPSGYNNYSSLLNTIRNLKSNIVILENLVGFCDEYCYTHLAEDVPDKYIIFLVEYEETLKFLPKGIYAHMGLIQCDRFFTTQLINDEEIWPGKITGSISSPPNSATRIKILNKISNLAPSSLVSTGYVNSRVKILETIAQEGDQISDLIKTIYTEFATIIEIYDHTEDYKEKHQNNKDPSVIEFMERLGMETI